MPSQNLLPKRVVRYIHEIGVRALDHLAEHIHVPPPAEDSENTAPDAVQTLVDHWKSMTADEKDEFVGRVGSSVVEVVAASATLPLSLKLEKAAKATKKALKRQTKKLRNLAKRASAAGNLKKTSKSKAKPNDKPKPAPKAKSKPKPKPAPKAKAKKKKG